MQSSRWRRFIQKTKPVFRVVGLVARRCVELFPLTWLGLFVGAVAGLALWQYGFGRLDLLLLVAGIVALGLLALSFVVTIVSSFILWLVLRNRKNEIPLHLECHAKARTGFSLTNFWFLPLLGVRWSWVSPEAEVGFLRERGRLLEQVRPNRRGFYDDITRRFELFDFFGLTKTIFYCTEKRQLKLLPSVGSLRHVDVLRSVAGGDALPHPRGALDGDRFDMRHYYPGDPIRFVLWKVYAKSRELMVRTPERALSPIRQTAAYVVAGRGDEPAAGAARAALEIGALGQEWVLGADGVSGHAKSKAEALELLARSASTSASDSGAGLDAFLRDAAPGGVGRAIVFVPAFGGDWVPKVLAAVQRKAAHGVSFVVCADSVLQPKKESLFSKLFWSPEASTPDTRSVAQLKELLRMLQKVNSTCTIVDRTRGQVFSAQQLLR
jgi:hypothetical protein